jgi:RNA polymerase sigma-70 factor (ECF subfamily)
MSGDSDGALLARSRDGDTDAFREIFERKHRRIYLIAYQVLGDAAQAEDVVQDVFLRLWQRCEQYDDAFPLDAWLRRIATNRAIDHWRSRKVERRHRAETPVDADPEALLDATPAAAARGGAFDPEAQLEWQQLQAIWDELAADLPPQQRAAFVLRHIEGAAPAEVAEALGCSLSTVRSHVSEARRTLRHALKSRYPELIDDS